MRTLKNLLLLWLSIGLGVMTTSCEKEKDDDNNNPLPTNAYVGNYDGVEATEMTLENGQLINQSSEDISTYVLIMKADGTYEVKDNGTPLTTGTYNATNNEADIDGSIYALELEGDNLYFTYQETSDSIQFQHQLYFLRQP